MFYKRIKTTFKKSTKISPLTWLHELSDDMLLSVDGKPLLLSVLMFGVTLCIDRAATGTRTALSLHPAVSQLQFCTGWSAWLMEDLQAISSPYIQPQTWEPCWKKGTRGFAEAPANWEVREETGGLHSCRAISLLRRDKPGCFITAGLTSFVTEVST